jgi:DNA invertase Pin-like site-specific DNA recombinase
VSLIYVRVSAKEQTENLSLPTQPRACEEYCRRQAYEILERFHEEGDARRWTGDPLPAASPDELGRWT